MNDIKFCTLYSGSGGNATYLSFGGTELLFDAGKSSRTLARSLCDIGTDIRNISAIFVTHEHTDHTGALEVTAKRYHIPVHITEASATRCVSRTSALASVVRTHPPLFSECFDGIRVTSFITPHDSALCVGYCISIGNTRFGIATDIGHMTQEIIGALTGCRHVVLESNHDVDMLKMGSYPYPLKQRILSPTGHLSNTDCAKTVALLSRCGTENIILAHLSEENNRPALARAASLEAIDYIGGTTGITVASPDAPTFCAATA